MSNDKRKGPKPMVLDANAGDVTMAFSRITSDAGVEIRSDARQDEVDAPIQATVLKLSAEGALVAFSQKLEEGQSLTVQLKGPRGHPTLRTRGEIVDASSPAAARVKWGEMPDVTLGLLKQMLSSWHRATTDGPLDKNVQEVGLHLETMAWLIARDE